MLVKARWELPKTRPLGGRRVLNVESVLRTRQTSADTVAGLGARELACNEQGGYALARAIASAGLADRLALKRVRRLL